MRRLRIQRALVGMLCFLAVPVASEETKVNQLVVQDLPGLAGKEGMMLTVEYAPGASTPRHRHNAHTFV